MPKKHRESPSMFVAARAVFEQAWQLPPDQRAAFVHNHCAGREALASHVLGLLRTAEETTVTLWPGAQATLDEPVRSAAVDELLHKLQSAPRLAAERYQLEGEVGRGGMGVVLRYRDQHLRRPLALKTMLPPDLPPSTAGAGMHTQLLGRFLEEAQITSQLEHPGVVPVHELGLDQDGQAYFTMRLVGGRELFKVFASVRNGEGGWTITRALEVMLKVCDTMAYAHGRGVVHRDLKPGNIMVGDFGEVYVMDWGLAKASKAPAAAGDDIAHAAAQGVQTVRQQETRDLPRSPLESLRGQLLGTPSYMSPEQAEGSDVDARTDVYAIGAMLYELLAGVAPYARPGEEVDSDQVVKALQHGPPTPVDELADSAPAELVAIVEKAMARELARRYQSPRELARDLRAFLDQRTVGAYRTGALVELRMWIRRNRPLAASLAAAVLLLVLGAAGTTAFAKERDASNRALDELATLLRADSAAAQVASLVPAWPQQLPRMEAWLQSTDILAELSARLSAAPSQPPTIEREPATDASDDLTQRIQRCQAYVDGLVRSKAVRDGSLLPATAELSAAQLAMTPKAKAEYAMRCVAPTAEARTVPDQEALGLALAQAAVQENQDPALAPDLLAVLAFAHLANGNDTAATTAAHTAEELAEAVRKPEFAGTALHVEQHLPQLSRLIEQAKTELARLQALRDGQTRTALHQALAAADSKRLVEAARNEIVASVETLQRRDRPIVQQRRNWAQQVAEATRAHPLAKTTWGQARAAIERADGISASTLYAGISIALEECDVYGLVPIGMNPVTKLWEFYDLRSAWDGTTPAKEIPIPEHDPETGRIQVTEATGIVFVLLPGGSFTMGTQSVDATRPNHDERTPAGTWPQIQQLAPFFMARHELTQGQWRRLWTGSGELARPSQFAAGMRFPGASFTDAHPVESVSAVMARSLLLEHALRLPTEAQWEYSARAGATTPWSTGATAESMAGHENCRDQSLAKANPGRQAAEFNDGFVIHAPVGTFASNPFGLHDMHGNVAEWCRDWYGAFEFPTGPGSGLRLTMQRHYVAFRGGAYAEPPNNCRVSLRRQELENARNAALGLRACRALKPLDEPID